jgi:predicted TPR repeat methyltransferase
MAMSAVTQAETILTRLVAADPDWLPGLVALCDALRSQKKIKDALNVYRHIETLSPDDALLRELRYRMFGSSE